MIKIVKSISQPLDEETDFKAIKRLAETAVFSSVKAAQLIHKNLPSDHDNFWDGIKIKV